MTGDRTIAISASVHTEDPDKAVRVVEVLSRALVGLALEDLYVSLSVHIMEPEDNGESSDG